MIKSDSACAKTQILLCFKPDFCLVATALMQHVSTITSGESCSSSYKPANKPVFKPHLRVMTIAKSNPTALSRRSARLYLQTFSGGRIINRCLPKLTKFWVFFAVFSSSVSTRAKLTLYTSLVHPKLLYCSVVYGHPHLLVSINWFRERLLNSLFNSTDLDYRQHLIKLHLLP